MRQSMQEQLVTLLNKNVQIVIESSNQPDLETPYQSQVRQNSLNDSLSKKYSSQDAHLAPAKPEVALSRSVFSEGNLSIRERLIAKGVIKPAAEGERISSKKAKLSADVEGGVIRRGTTRKQDRGSVLDFGVLTKTLSTRGVVDGVDYLSLVGELQERQEAKRTLEVRPEPLPSKQNAFSVTAKKSKNKNLDANNAATKDKASFIYRHQKRFKCTRCGEWIHFGQGLKHEAMHEGRDYMPLADVRPKSMSRIKSPAIPNSRWVYVFQGGLPSLGKRSR